MGEETAISWCDHTFNGWWGCVRVSEACRHCYAEALAKRFGVKWGTGQERRFFGDDHWNEPRKWNRKAARDGVRRRVFCSSMSDVFEKRDDLIQHRQRLWHLIQDTPSLDWLLLTKRPENFLDMLPWPKHLSDAITEPPWFNTWLGVTAEDNEHMESRVLQLRGVPARVRFISCEPILENIADDVWDLALAPRPGLGDIHWLIVGDESGHNRRPAHVDWIRRAREAALRHGVAFHFKQWNSVQNAEIGGRDIRGKTKIHLPILDGRQWAQFPQ